MRNYLVKIWTLFAIITLPNNEINAQQFHEVPSQILNIYQLMGYDYYTKDTVDKVIVSDLIPYKEYKKYLESIKDSSEQFYKTQLPDTSIAPDKGVYQEYITSAEYDTFPVLGISWEGAMNYCKWKTLKDNKKGKIKFIYRLPKHSEWLSTLHYCNENQITFDIDDKYSDWLLNSFDESAYNFGLDYSIDYAYFHKTEDPLVLKRKRVVGESYLYSIPPAFGIDDLPSYRYGYSTIGYRQVAFRIVKTKKIDKNLLKYWGLEK